MNIKHSRITRSLWAVLCALWISEAMAEPAQKPPKKSANEEFMNREAGPIVEGVQLILQTEESKFSPYSPILMRISVKNTTDKMLNYVVSHVHRDYEFMVTDEKGEPIPLTRYGQSQLKPLFTAGSVGNMDMDPGGEWRDEIIINRYFDMTLEGVYLIKCIRKRVEKLDKSELVPIVSGVLRVKVDDSLKAAEKPVPSNPTTK